MSEPRYKRDTFPQWLGPFKNEWRTAARLRDLFEVEGGTWLSVIERLKASKRGRHELCSNGLTATRWQVKQAWAILRSEGVKIVPAIDRSADKNARIELTHARAEISYLKQELARLRKRDQIPSLIAGNGDSDAICSVKSLLLLLASATEARPVGGVYFLLRGNDIVYVGQSSNVAARMHGHREKTFETIKMIAISQDAQRLQYEEAFIKALQPVLNRTHVLKSGGGADGQTKRTA